MDVIARLPYPRSGDRQGQETFLAPSADKRTRNYDTECSVHLIISSSHNLSPFIIRNFLRDYTRRLIANPACLFHYELRKEHGTKGKKGTFH